MPLASRGAPSWATDMPTWLQARAALQQRCVCLRLETVACCWGCAGCVLPQSTASSAVPLVWPDRCLALHACSQTWHFRGQCRWNCGASRHYALLPHENIGLCPDCSWQWLQAWDACPRRRAVVIEDPDLLRHVRATSLACQPGAGTQSSESHPLNMRRVRRWLLRRLQACRQEEGLPLAQLLEMCHAARICCVNLQQPCVERGVPHTT